MGSNAMTQSGYSTQTVTNGKLAIHARVNSDEGVAPVKIRTDVTGELNAEGRPMGLKSIDYAEPRRAMVTGRTSEFLAATGDNLDLDFSAEETYNCGGGGWDHHTCGK